MSIISQMIATKLNKQTPIEVPNTINTIESIDDDLIFLTSDKEVTRDEPIAYLAGEYDSPRDDLFIVIHIPFLHNPYSFNISTYRSYKRWLLHPAQYILGSFASSRYDNLRNTILRNFAPSSTMDIHNLFMMLSEFELTVPGKFESVFVEIIERNKKNLNRAT